MNSVLKSAQDSLRILDVNLRRSSTELNEEYEHFFLDNIDPKIQIFRNVSNVYSLSDEEHSGVVTDSSVNDEEISPKFYIFRYSVGIRLVEQSSEEDNNENPLVFLELTADFDAKYMAKRRLTDEEIEIFSKDNVGINVWPYWREFIHSTCGKMGIKKFIPIPFYRINSKSP